MPGLPLGTAIASLFFANVLGASVIVLVSVTCFMFAGAAEANTSAGAPWLSCWASAELPPKLNLTFVPGWAASKSSPSWVNVSVSDAAANTVTSPVGASEPDAGAAACWPEPHPASTSAAEATALMNLMDLLFRRFGTDTS